MNTYLNNIRIEQRFDFRHKIFCEIDDEIKKCIFKKQKIFNYIGSKESLCSAEEFCKVHKLFYKRRKDSIIISLEDNEEDAKESIVKKEKSIKNESIFSFVAMVVCFMILIAFLSTGFNIVTYLLSFL